MYVDTILDAVTPEMIVVRLYPQQMHTSSGKMEAIIDDVGKVVVYGNGYFFSDCFDTIRAGSIIDLVAVTKCASDYVEAVKIITREFSDILPPDYASPQVVEKCAEEARLQRRIFNACVINVSPPSEMPIPMYALLGDSVRSNSAGVMSCLTKPRATELKKRLADAGSDAFVPDGACYIVPWFSRCHRVDGYKVVWKSGNNTRVKMVTLRDDAAVSYAGFVSGAPGDSACVVGSFDEVVDSVIRPIYSPVVGTGSRLPDTTTLNATGSSDNISAFAPMLTRYSTLAPGKDIMWNGGSSLSHAMRLVLLERLLRDREFTPETRVVAESVFAGSDTIDKLREWARTEGLYKVEQTLGVEFRSGIVCENATTRIYDTPDGYMLEWKNSDLPTTPLSNFTLRFTETVRFDEATTVFRGMICVKGVQYPIQMSLDELDTVRRIEGSVHSWETGLPEDLRESPVVFDATAMRPVIPHLRRSVAGLPKLNGISFLGWNASRTSFYTPFGIIEEGGISDKLPDVLHPGVLALSNFAITDSQCDTEHPAKEGDNVVLDAFLTMITQEYESTCKDPCVFACDLLTKDFVERTFAALGQVSPIKLNRNMRLHEDCRGLLGWPPFAIGYNEAQTRMSAKGMVILQPYGDAVKKPLLDSAKLRGAVVNRVRHILARGND
ncbi:MAG: hypothetical protein RR382_00300 [Tannerellaceae bacterium]